jgi:hypothetical protein
MARVNILQRVKTLKGWSNVPLKRTPKGRKGRIQWPSVGHYLLNGVRMDDAYGNPVAKLRLRRSKLKNESASSLRHWLRNHGRAERRDSAVACEGS